MEAMIFVLLLNTLIGVGATLAITSSDIFAPLRKLLNWLWPPLRLFIGCNFCVGFWVFGGLSLLTFDPVMFFMGHALMEMNYELARIIIFIMNGLSGSILGLIFINKLVY